MNSQIYRAGGYYAVYSASLAFNVTGILYISVIPESVTVRNNPSEFSVMRKNFSCLEKTWHMVKEGNKMILDAIK